ncbi:polysaccharide pyruvyl transferase family protein [Brevundimonas sp.]|uniref:polysaccharide pyruvyl transferase family protein n=1 Tax=Brevundimonas sp. TaxID=1871086 RepID=UPI002D2CDC0D|nr:polysaccharide pyruvyl transferase family protein [Brevundimonas sp.]HYD28102.1 polysaccharide pyruvyl transferase family protein [Brevundimonas sp.]
MTTTQDDTLVICGAAAVDGIQNFGDELLQQIYTRWAQEADPGLHVVMHGTDEASALADGTRLRGVGFIGGGYLGEKATGRGALHEWLRNGAWGVRNQLLYGSALALARRHGVPHCVSSVEFGPISNPFYRAFAVRLLSTAEHATVRNPDSREFAIRYGVSAGKVNVCPDVALELTRRTVQQARSGEPPRIGLHLHAVGGETWREGIATLVNAALQNGLKGAEICFIYDQVKAGERPASARKAEAFARERWPDVRVIPYENVEQLLSRLDEMNLIITTKLHVGVVGRALHRQVLSLPVVADARRFAVTKMPRFYRSIDEAWRCVDLTSDAMPESLLRFASTVSPEAAPLPVTYLDQVLTERERYSRFVLSRA